MLIEEKEGNKMNFDEISNDIELCETALKGSIEEQQDVYYLLTGKYTELPFSRMQTNPLFLSRHPAEYRNCILTIKGYLQSCLNEQAIHNKTVSNTSIEFSNDADKKTHEDKRQKSNSSYLPFNTDIKKKYQVFISSTYSDLIEERMAVTQCLLDNDCIPIGMEQFSASNMSQMEYIERVLKDCDYYILILAGRYGSLDKDGIGFTEKEYQYAESQGIPILSFVVKNPDNLPVSKSAENDKEKELLKAFRETVCKNRMVAFYNNIDDLKAAVATAINRCIKDLPAVGWVRAYLMQDADLKQSNNRAIKKPSEQEIKDALQEKGSVKFVITNNEKYKFHVVAQNFEIIYVSIEYDTAEECRNAAIAFIETYN